MKVSEMAKLIGQEFSYCPDAYFMITVKITDVKIVYGIVKIQITPVSGVGFKWINAPRTLTERKD